MKRRVLLGLVALTALAAPALTYAAYSSRLPSDEAAAAPIVLPATKTADETSPKVPEEAAMVVAGMALIGAAAIVRRAA